MGKIENNKKQKLNSILSTAFHLFTTKGVSDTSIAEISEQAGVAKGTFYLYFKDKYDIRNKLISHESSKLFKQSHSALLEYCNSHPDISLSFEEKMLFIIDHIIDILAANKSLLTFISKNLSWGIFKEALTNNVHDDDINFRDVFLLMIEESENQIDQPEIMLFMIVEFASSTCYSSILYSEPTDINSLKPYLYQSIGSIIKNHMKV